jgi:hypothetical protein
MILEENILTKEFVISELRRVLVDRHPFNINLFIATEHFFLKEENPLNICSLDSIYVLTINNEFKEGFAIGIINKFTNNAEEHTITFNVTTLWNTSIETSISIDEQEQTQRLKIYKVVSSYFPEVFIPVEEIEGIPDTIEKQTPMLLYSGRVQPYEATFQMINWSISTDTDENIKAQIFDNFILYAKNTGTVHLIGTVPNGSGEDVDFVQEFEIEVVENNSEEEELI